MTNGSYILSLDQGTTSSRAILFDHAGQVVSLAQKEFPQHFPQSGWVEHDPQDILASQLEVMELALTSAQVSSSQIAAIGITNQRETTIVWDRATGKPIYNAIVWQCRRTASMIEELAVQEGMAQMIRSKTGLVPDPYFSGSKIAWILDNVPGARQRAQAGELAFGTVDSWLIWHLTEGRVHATDYTNASRTMLFNIHTLDWDEELLQLFDIPKAMLPAVLPSSADFGITAPAILAGDIPICGVAGDQQAALFGQCCFEAGDVKNTYGTGGFLLMNTGSTPVVSDHGLLTTMAATADGSAAYALEGSVFVAGAVMQWLRDEMGLIENAGESEECALRAQDTGGVYLVPAFTGLGAPYWDSYARGAILGLTRGTSKDQVVRAALESLAYQSADVIATMEKDAGVKLGSLKVDGGAAANNVLLQFQADILQTPVVRPLVTETTALGASYLAGLKIGYWESLEDLKNNWKLDCCFEVQQPQKWATEKLDGWHGAVSQVLLRSRS